MINRSVDARLTPRPTPGQAPPNDLPASSDVRGCYHRRRSWGGGGGGGGGSRPMKILGANISFCPPPPPNNFDNLKNIIIKRNARIGLKSTVNHYKTIKFI